MMPPRGNAQVSTEGEGKQINRQTLPPMTDPDPFLAVISSSTALLLVAFALASTML
jgi:hypothetical protein